MAVLGTVLSILWFVIKVILWLIVGLVGLLLLLLLMVIFVPVTYDVSGSRYDHIKGEGKVTYLFGLLRFLFHYGPDGYAYQGKALFFTLVEQEQGGDAQETETAAFSRTEGTFKATEKAARSQEPSPEEEALEEIETIDEGKELEATEEAEETGEREETEGAEAIEKTEEPSPPEERVSEKEDEEAEGKAPKTETVAAEAPQSPSQATEEKDPTKTDTQQKTKKKSPQKSKTKKKKKKQKPENKGLATAKHFYGFLRREENRGVLRFMLKKLFKAMGTVLPKRFEGKIHFGTGDPAMTGYLFGGASVFYPKYKDKLVLTPNFDKFILEGEARIGGRIQLWPFVWAAIRILADGRVRRLIKEVRQTL